MTGNEVTVVKIEVAFCLLLLLLLLLLAHLLQLGFHPVTVVLH